jgi:hypothetical protein
MVFEINLEVYSDDAVQGAEGSGILYVDDRQYGAVSPVAEEDLTSVEQRSNQSLRHN